MYKFFERNHLPICDQDALKCLGADELLYNPKLNISDYFSDDIAVLRRRSIVFGDALNVSGLYELLQNMVKKLSGISDILHSESEIGDKERSIFCAKQLQLYFEGSIINVGVKPTDIANKKQKKKSISEKI